MPYSPIFIHNLRLRATPCLIKSMSSLPLLKFHRGFHFSPQNPAFSRRRPPPHRHQFRAGVAFPNCTCFAAGSSPSPNSASVLLKRIGNDASSSSSVLPYFYQQSMGYGRFAYDEYASEEDDYPSDREMGSKEMVGLLVSLPMLHWVRKNLFIACFSCEVGYFCFLIKRTELYFVSAKRWKVVTCSRFIYKFRKLTGLM